MKRIIWLFLLLLSSLSYGQELTIFAAASLNDALKEIGGRWEQMTGNKVTFNFAASSTLQQQIASGAPADLFLSADEAKMDQLAQRDLLQPGTRKSFLSNTLIVVVRKDSQLSVTKIADLLGPKITRLALAQPDTVPAGIYAKTFLESVHAWDALKARVLPTENVRAALAAVEAGNAEAGFVYKSDASAGKEVKIAWEVPAAAGPKISYAAAVLRRTPHAALAAKFLAYLEAPLSRETFQKLGFRLPAEHD